MKLASITTMMLCLIALAIPMSLNSVIPDPVEWRCEDYDIPGGRRLHFQGRTYGQHLGWAWYNSFGERNNGQATNRMHNDGESYALINIWTDYIDEEFWIDIAIWDSDTLNIRLQVPDTEKVCQQ